MGCVGALGGAEDAIADAETGGSGGGVGGESEDGSCKLGTTDPGEGRLMLVFALDLEDVEEVGAGGVDLNEVFVWRWAGGGDFGDGEITRALVVDQRVSVGEESRENFERGNRERQGK